MNVYSHQIFQRAGVSAPTAVPPPPPGTMYVVRCIDYYYEGLTAASARAAFNSGGTFSFFAFAGTDIATWSQWQGRQAIPPGVGFYFNASHPTDITCSGYVLQLP
jgi:hypothetical protein